MSALTTERTAAAGGFILVLRFFAAALLNYAFGVVLAWVMVPAQFGTVSALQAVLLLAALVLSAGFPWALAWKTARLQNYDSAEIDGSFRMALVGNVALALLLAALVLVLQLGGVRLIPSHSVTLIATVAGTFPVLAFNSVLAGALQGGRRFGGLGALQTAEVFGKCVVGLTLVVVFGAGPEGVALGVLGGSLVATCVGLWSLRDRLPGWGRLGDFATVRRALPIWIGTAGFGLLSTLDLLGLTVLGVGHGVTASVLAAYQVSAILARAPFYIADALIDAVFPFMARHGSRAVSHGWFIAAIRWIPLLILPGQLVLLFLPGPVLSLLFPSEYGKALTLLQVLDFGTLGLILTGMHLKALYALDLASVVGRRMPFAVLAEVVALTFLVPRYGDIGAAIAFCVASWTGALLLVPAYLRRQEHPFPRPAVVGRYLAAIAVLVPVLLLAGHVPEYAALGLAAVGLACFVIVARSLGIISDIDVGHVHSALGRVRSGVLRRRARRREASLPQPVGPGPSPSGRRVPGGAGIGPALGTVSQDRRARWRRLSPLLIVCAVLAAAPMLYNLMNSPDTVYDEVVYTKAAQNVATGWHLTWTNEPLFVHPPLSFLAQAEWLRLLGVAHSPLVDAIHAARFLSATVGAVNVVLVAWLVNRLSAAAGPRRRGLLTIVVALLAATDPVLLRFSRLAIIEPFALLASLVTLHVAWSLRRRSAFGYISAVGLLTGIAVLTNEISVFLIVTPIVFALLERSWTLVRRTVGAAAVGLGLWLLFPLWALQLELGGFFADVKFSTLERLLGLIQITGLNRPGVSLTAALLRSAAQYSSSYLFLAVGVLALLWLFLRRNTQEGNYLFAWLITSYAFAAWTVGFGTFNEQFFVYIMPAAIAGTVLGVDAILANRIRLTRRGRHRRDQRLTAGVVRRRALAVGLPAAGLMAVLVASTGSWVQHYTTANDGVFSVTQFISRRLPACAVVNASGDPDKFSYLLDGRRFTTFVSGPAALSRGVHYYLLDPNDVVAHYGGMSPRFAAWIHRNGQLLATYPSQTYGGVGLWRVSTGDYNAVADIENIPGGVFVHTQSARCGGFAITNGAAGDYFRAYQSLGGKGMVGAPLSTVWATGGQTYQAFDTAVLTNSAGQSGGSSAVHPMSVVATLSSTAPAIYRQYDFPPILYGPGNEGSVSATELLRLLNDAPIARVYLGVDAAGATAADVQRAQQLFGSPLGPATKMPDGQIRQAFPGVILTRPADGGPVRLAAVGRAAVQAQVVTLPASAKIAATRPVTDAPTVVRRPTSVLPFVRSAGAALFGYALVVALIAVLRRRRRQSRAIRRSQRERASRRGPPSRRHRPGRRLHPVHSSLRRCGRRQSDERRG